MAKENPEKTNQTEPVPVTYGSVWDNLSAVDCTNQIKKKNGKNYLSWAWAWGILMDNYPGARFDILDEVTMADGSMECRVKVFIPAGKVDLERFMWLPVMDNRMKAVKNPDARAINDTRMRCFVKCLALFGLGHYIYAGEDIPPDADFEGTDHESSAPVPLEQYQVDALMEWIEVTDTDIPSFVGWLTEGAGESLADLTSIHFDAGMKALKLKHEKMPEKKDGN